MNSEAEAVVLSTLDILFDAIDLSDVYFVMSRSFNISALLVTSILVGLYAT